MSVLIKSDLLQLDLLGLSMKIDQHSSRVDFCFECAFGQRSLRLDSEGLRVSPCLPGCHDENLGHTRHVVLLRRRRLEAQSPEAFSLIEFNHAPALVRWFEFAGGPLVPRLAPWPDQVLRELSARLTLREVLAHHFRTQLAQTDLAITFGQLQ